MTKTWSVGGFKSHGVGVRTKPISQVEFVCPRCGADRAGTVSSSSAGITCSEFRACRSPTLDGAVDCDTCGHRAGLAVLEVLTANELTACLEQRCGVPRRAW